MIDDNLIGIGVSKNHAYNDNCEITYNRIQSKTSIIYLLKIALGLKQVPSSYFIQYMKLCPG